MRPVLRRSKGPGTGEDVIREGRVNEHLRQLVEQLAGTGAVIVVPAERRQSQMAAPGVMTRVPTSVQGFTGPDEVRRFAQQNVPGHEGDSQARGPLDGNGERDVRGMKPIEDL